MKPLSLSHLFQPLLLASALVLVLPGCDQLQNQLNKPARDAKATGAGCRLSGRSLEDCYKRNPRAARAEVYAGWKEMNDYMEKQKLEEMAPPPDDPKPEPAAEAEEDAPAKDKKDSADSKDGTAKDADTKDAKPDNAADKGH